MLGAALAFSLMGVAVKAASVQHGTGEIVFWRALIGMAFMALMLRARGHSVATTMPRAHLSRSVSGTAAQCLWFWAIAGLPLGTATTLNYTSSIWVALFVLGTHLLVKRQRLHAVDGQLALTVVAGFIGVALVLQPGAAQGHWPQGLGGVLSGLLGGVAYLQLQGLGRAGEPGERVVFYYCACGVVAGLLLMVLSPRAAAWPSMGGLALLLAVGVLATLGQWAMTRAYAIGQALSNAALQYMGIVFSFALGVWLFGDPVTPAALAGMALIVGSGIAAARLSRAPPAAA